MENSLFSRTVSLLVASSQFRGDLINRDIVALLVPPEHLATFAKTDVAQLTPQGIPVHSVPGLQTVVYLRKDGSTEKVDMSLDPSKAN